MRHMLSILIILAGAMFVVGCKRTAEKEPSEKPTPESPTNETHVHDDGSTHADHGDDAHADGEDHAHDEAPLGKVTIGDMEIELAQGHGKVEAGKEGHLVVKLPYSDNGSTIVRVWLGTEDRTLSQVGKGEYAASHDDYDVHAVAPSPLPDNVMWWIEIAKPNGTKVVGAAKPLLD